jgi:Protein of unknown function (DUF4230)
MKQQQHILDTTRITIINKLESVGNLETVTMRVEKIVEGKQGLVDLLPNYSFDNVVQKFLFEDSLQMVAYGDIAAGFDLREIATGSISITSGNIVSLMLPKAKILHASLAPETKPFIRKRGLLTK